MMARMEARMKGQGKAKGFVGYRETGRAKGKAAGKRKDGGKGKDGKSKGPGKGTELYNTRPGALVAWICQECGTKHNNLGWWCRDKDCRKEKGNL